jgi:hypothetical protein
MRLPVDGDLPTPALVADWARLDWQRLIQRAHAGSYRLEEDDQRKLVDAVEELLDWWDRL